MEFVKQLNASRAAVNRSVARNPVSGVMSARARAEIHEIVHGGPRPQAKLTVGAPDDVYEQEADRVADEVMRMPDAEVQRMEAGEEEPEEEVQRMPLNTHSPPQVQRLCPACEEEMQRKADVDSGREAVNDVGGSMPQLQRQAAEDEGVVDVEEPISLKRAEGGGEVETTDLDHIVGSAFAGGGSPLSDSQRAFFESRFGADFSSVRVHTDTAAQTASRQINAKAFTHGTGIAFASGAYQPESAEGQRLLAHELTHTIQQGAASQDGEVQRQPEVGVSTGSADVIQREKEIHLNLHHAIDEGRVVSPQTVRLYDDAGATVNYTTSAGTGDLTSQHIRRAPYHITSKVGPPPAKTAAWGLQYFMPFVGGVGFHSNICFPKRSTLCNDGAAAYCSGDQNERVRRVLTVDGTPHSHGCARLSHGNAEDLFNAVDVNTRVYVYERSSWRSPSWSSEADRAQPE